MKCIEYVRIRTLLNPSILFATYGWANWDTLQYVPDLTLSLSYLRETIPFICLSPFSLYVHRMANHIYFSCSHDSVLCVWKYEANVGAVSHCLQLRGHDDTSRIKAVDMDETRYAVDFFSQGKIIGNLFPEWKCVKYITCAWYSVRRVGINNYIFFY